MGIDGIVPCTDKVFVGRERRMDKPEEKARTNFDQPTARVQEGDQEGSDISAKLGSGSVGVAEKR